MQHLLPPVLFAFLLAASSALGMTFPLLGPAPLALRVLAVPLAAAALWCNLRGARLFTRRGANIKTFDDPTVLVVDGPFRFTRNPMYLGFTLLLAATALAVGTATAWLGAIVFAAAAQFWYIPFEEARMRARFGPQYAAYASDVDRWLSPGRIVSRGSVDPVHPVEQVDP